MRIMGIDYGDSRIGISISDPLGITAQSLETVSSKKGLDSALERIAALAAEYCADRIVVGFPKNMNGTIGPRGERTLEFISLLEKKTGLRVIKWDERLTTVAANRAMQEMGVKTKKKKDVVDQIAAVYILQGYLDSIRLT
jgi:putative Holliday junction resolvase